MTGTIIEIEVPVGEFALAETFARLDGIACEIERVVAHDTDRIMPFVWVRGGDNETKAVTAALADDPTIDSFDLLADLDSEWLYRMEWTDHIETLVQILVENDGTIMAASGEVGVWSLRIRFAGRDALSRTHEYCKSHGLTFEVQQIYQLDESRQGRFGLTDHQQDTLAKAFERGYYEIPRETAAKGIADELDISHQALSEVFRRGHESLIENTVVFGRGERSDRSR